MKVLRAWCLRPVNIHWQSYALCYNLIQAFMCFYVHHHACNMKLNTLSKRNILCELTILTTQWCTFCHHGSIMEFSCFHQDCTLVPKLVYKVDQAIFTRHHARFARNAHLEITEMKLLRTTKTVWVLLFFVQEILNQIAVHATLTRRPTPTRFARRGPLDTTQNCPNAPPGGNMLVKCFAHIPHFCTTHFQGNILNVTCLQH